MKLLGKIIISGSLVTQTGLHLGGSKSSLNIGGIDNNVIKDAKGRPYIPGSSIKGKMRSLLAKVHGSLFFDKKSKEKALKEIKGEKIKAIIGKAASDDEIPSIIDLFGYSGDADEKEKNERVGYTRLLVRDAFLKNETNSIFKSGYTDSKWENVIDRKTGTAEHPRQLERVPVGAEFGLELVYNIYQDPQSDKEDVSQHLRAILLSLQLLQDDGIGGSISRGYGQIKVEIKNVEYKMIDASTYKYETMTPVSESEVKVLNEFSETFSTQA